MGRALHVCESWRETDSVSDRPRTPRRSRATWLGLTFALIMEGNEWGLIDCVCYNQVAVCTNRPYIVRLSARSDQISHSLSLETNHSE